MPAESPTPEEREWTLRVCGLCFRRIDDDARHHLYDWHPETRTQIDREGLVLDVVAVPRERAERAERYSGVWEARFMDAQSARRIAEVERDELHRDRINEENRADEAEAERDDLAQLAHDANEREKRAERERDEALRQRDHDYKRFTEAKQAILAADSERVRAVAEHERVRREVAGELRGQWARGHVVSVVLSARLDRLASRLVSSGGEETG